jgi:hypothetical protein
MTKRTQNGDGVFGGETRIAARCRDVKGNGDFRPTTLQNGLLPQPLGMRYQTESHCVMTITKK